MLCIVRFSDTTELTWQGELQFFQPAPRLLNPDYSLFL